MLENLTVPAFEATATGGKTVSPAVQAGRPFVLYFYPKDNTPGCTDESLQFRELHGEFAKAG
ncbi:MAG: redoxin domain-containing protein, partial [Burkholderiales bacterium]|nr:redoxin domain-containing protein [Burkholderiales bacterium]